MAERELTFTVFFSYDGIYIFAFEHFTSSQLVRQCSLHNEGCLGSASAFPRPCLQPPQYLSPISWQATSFADRLFNFKIMFYILISFLGQFGATFAELFLNNISKMVKLIPGFIIVSVNRVGL